MIDNTYKTAKLLLDGVDHLKGSLDGYIQARLARKEQIKSTGLRL